MLAIKFAGAKFSTHNGVFVPKCDMVVNVGFSSRLPMHFTLRMSNIVVGFLILCCLADKKHFFMSHDVLNCTHSIPATCSFHVHSSYTKRMKNDSQIIQMH